jgi:hypothetical protein
LSQAAIFANMEKVFFHKEARLHDHDLVLTYGFDYLIPPAAPAPGMITILGAPGSDVITDMGGRFNTTANAVDVPSVESPVITVAYGVETELNGTTFSWTVDFEDAVAYYEVEQLINGEWVVVSTVTQGGTYSVTVPATNGTYRLVSVDTDGTKHYYSTSDLEQYVNLNAGWNMISVPFADADTTALTTVANTVWEWKADAYVEATEFVPGVGYWTYSETEAFGVKITGTVVAENAVSLTAGWSLVGPTVDCTAPVGYSIFGWDMKYDAVLEATGKLYSGYGYWFYSERTEEVDLSK